MLASQLNVCFSANNAYAQHFCVACYSLLKNTPGDWNIYLLTDDLDELNEKKVQEMVSKVSKNSSIEIIRVSADDFKQFPKIDRLGIQAYFRLNITKLLPQSVDTLLYLDSDLIVLKNILEVLPSNINGPLLAVQDGASKSQQIKRNLQSQYFNSGVLVIPMNYWRDNHVSEKILAREYANIALADQDILNDFFNGEWKNLDKRLNVKGFDPKYMNYFSFLEVHKEAYIIHYMDVWKPWNRIFRTGLIYWRYLLKTPYRFNCIKLPSVLFKTFKQILFARKNVN